MALNLASPGIVVREVDLTIGRVDATSGSIGAVSYTHLTLPTILLV